MDPVQLLQCRRLIRREPRRLDGMQVGFRHPYGFRQRLCRRAGPECLPLFQQTHQSLQEATAAGMGAPGIDTRQHGVTPLYPPAKRRRDEHEHAPTPHGCTDACEGLGIEARGGVEDGHIQGPAQAVAPCAGLRGLDPCRAPAGQALALVPEAHFGLAGRLLRFQADSLTEQFAGHGFRLNHR